VLIEFNACFHNFVAFLCVKRREMLDTAEEAKRIIPGRANQESCSGNRKNSHLEMQSNETRILHI
jgi:hypothetical protein